MPQLFGSMINAAIINSVLWYYLLGKFPFELMLTYKLKFLISYQLAFFVMAWIWCAIQLFNNTRMVFLDALINGIKLPFFNILLMIIPIVGIYILINIWSGGGWDYRIKYIIAVVLCGVFFWLSAYSALSVLYEEEMQNPNFLYKFLLIAIWGFIFSILYVPFKIVKGIVYDLPIAFWHRKFEILTLVVLLGGAVWTVDYLMLKGKFWKSSVAYVKDLGGEMDTLFGELVEDSKSTKKSK